MGADKGVHVVDDAIAGSDALATSLVLAEAIEKIGEAAYDLVVCGMASTDGSMSVVPAMLAERLDAPAGDARLGGRDARATRSGSSATATPRPRSIGGTLPLVLSVTDQSGEARYPSFKGIMAAKKKPLETWSLSDLGVDAGEVGPVGGLDRGRGHHGPSAAHGRRDRHGRGRHRAPRRWPSSSPSKKFI